MPAPQSRRLKPGSAMRAIAKAKTKPESAKERYARYIEQVQEVVEHDATLPAVQKFAVTAVAKPRMTQSDSWNKRDAVLRYRAYGDEMRLLGAKLPYAYHVEFILPMPDSWPEEVKQAMDGAIHLLKPDTSNLCKAIEDVLVAKDEVIHNISATKHWGRTPLITIRKAQRRVGED